MGDCGSLFIGFLLGGTSLLDVTHMSGVPAFAWPRHGVGHSYLRYRVRFGNTTAARASYLARRNRPQLTSPGALGP